MAWLSHCSVALSSYAAAVGELIWLFRDPWDSIIGMIHRTGQSPQWWWSSIGVWACANWQLTRDLLQDTHNAPLIIIIIIELKQ